MSKELRDAGRIPALNFHVWQPCNMRCRYCFAGFAEATAALQKDKAHLRERAMDVVRAAADAGIQKLTLVGGEPTLCSWLIDLLTLATTRGMVTMVVSNGTRMDSAWISRHADLLRWAAISVDSLNPETNRRIGRTVGNKLAPDEGFYAELFANLAASGIRTKMNTVVSRLNWREDFTEFLRRARPERWKVLQALHIHGENDAAFPELATTREQFHYFVEAHRSLDAQLMMAAEDNDAMTGSYLMVDPVGRFFTNEGGVYRYSEPIWTVGWARARAQVMVDESKFIARGGIYAW